MLQSPLLIMKRQWLLRPFASGKTKGLLSIGPSQHPHGYVDATATTRPESRPSVLLLLASKETTPSCCWCREAIPHGESPFTDLPKCPSALGRR